MRQNYQDKSNGKQERWREGCQCVHGCVRRRQDSSGEAAEGRREGRELSHRVRIRNTEVFLPTEVRAHVSTCKYEPAENAVLCKSLVYMACCYL